ncbi:MAG: rod shape-determining protein [SAR324 cluster bacterium]|nr:rod shape-determining protein [SAR324 cluster bacterium]
MGIDLGTSRTAVCTNRGVKADFASVVGYPKDIIGSRLLNGTKLIGDAALNKRSYLNVFYPLEAGVIKESSETEVKAARDLLEYAVSMAQPRENDTLCAVIGVPARASVANREMLLRLASEMLDKALVVSEPFMVAYGINQLNQALIIDIGAGTIDLCAMKGNVPSSDNQVTISSGGDYIDIVLRNLIMERYPDVAVSKYLARAIKEAHSFVGKMGVPAMADFRSYGKPVRYDVTQEIKTACETIISPIIEHFELLLQKFEPEDQADVLQNIFLAGNGSLIRGLSEVLIDRLKEFGELKITLVDDPDYAGCKGALKLATDLPFSHWNQIGDVIGM